MMWAKLREPAGVFKQHRAILAAAQKQYDGVLDIHTIEYGVIADGDEYIETRYADTLGEKDGYWLVLENRRIVRRKYYHLVSVDAIRREAVGDNLWSAKLTIDLNPKGIASVWHYLYCNPMYSDDARAELQTLLQAQPDPPVKPSNMTHDDYDRIRRQVEYRIHPESTEAENIQF